MSADLSIAVALGYAVQMGRTIIRQETDTDTDTGTPDGEARYA